MTAAVAAKVAAARARLLPSPSDARFTPPGEPPIPAQFTAFRRHQWKAIEAVDQYFRDGAQVVFLDAPTGSGKTLAAEVSRRLVGGNGLYVCSTKTLQDQMAGDFDYGHVLKGRSNYETLSGSITVDSWGRRRIGPADDNITCADCTATAREPNCRWCSPTVRCPYRQARDRAQTANLAILNTSYLLTDANKGARRFAGRDLTIVDEADLLESELLGHIEVKMTAARMKRLGIHPPGRATVEASWLPWVADEAIPKVQARLYSLPPLGQGTTGQLRERKGLAELLERLEALAVELPESGWVYDGYRTERGKVVEGGDVIFRPIEVGKWGRSMLWPHSKRWLLMSGSFVSIDFEARNLGLEETGLDWRSVSLPMSFPAANRPIYPVALTEVNAKNRETSWPKLAEGLAGVLALHPNERILVHAVSYPLVKHLADEIRRRAGRRQIVTYTKASERAGALRLYRDSPGAVLIAPSMDRGVDLPGDLCRVVVVCKIPYPNLGDKRTAARLYGTGQAGKNWYAVNTVRTLVQMTGRGVRSDTDHATCYILDHSFTSNVWQNSRNLLPAWWREAVDWGLPARRLISAAADLAF